jgi:hypothetical protein
MNKEKTYSVYMHTNKANGKRYIGVTSLKPKARWQNGNGYKDQPSFFDDIVKYGWDNIEHEVLFSGLTKEEGYKKEKELIRLYETTSPDKGYNSHGKGVYCIELNMVFNNITEASQETGASISGICLCVQGKNKTAGNYHWCHATEKDTKGFLEEKIEKDKEKYKALKKPVLCIETGQIFSSSRDAARELSIDSSGIRKVCRGTNKTCGGYHWEYVNEGSAAAC